MGLTPIKLIYNAEQIVVWIKFNVFLFGLWLPLKRYLSGIQMQNENRHEINNAMK